MVSGPHGELKARPLTFFAAPETCRWRAALAARGLCVRVQREAACSDRESLANIGSAWRGWVSPPAGRAIVLLVVSHHPHTLATGNHPNILAIASLSLAHPPTKLQHKNRPGSSDQLSSHRYPCSVPHHHRLLLTTTSPTTLFPPLHRPTSRSVVSGHVPKWERLNANPTTFRL